MTSSQSGSRPASLQPTPANATVVFEGEIFQVLRWHQEMFDGSVRVFEKVRRSDTSFVLPVVNGALRIIRQEQPGYSAPFFDLIGGRVDQGESAEAAARRELLEEAGLHAGSLRLWASVQPFAKIDWAIHIFIADNCSRAGSETTDPGERMVHIDVSWEELVELAQNETFRDVSVALQILRAAADPDRDSDARRFLGLSSPEEASRVPDGPGAPTG